MAKYTRFDPRNKNRGKHKSRSMDKDIRIREVEDTKYRNNSVLLREVVYDEYEDEDEYLTEGNS